MHYELDTATTWRVNEKAPRRATVSAKITSTPEATAIADRDLILSVMGPDFNEDDASSVLDAIACLDAGTSFLTNIRFLSVVLVQASGPPIKRLNVGIGGYTMKMYEVLDHVSMWLDEPRNRCVEDQLYLIEHCSKKYRKEALKNIITARIYQGLNVDPSTLSPVFIGRCVGAMWRWYYCD